MKKYRKKPVVIEAVQWTGNNLREIIAFTDGQPDTRKTYTGMKWEEYEDLVSKRGLIIFTLEGKHIASVGDFIIKGIQGEYYPCKPEIFLASYEEVISDNPSNKSEQTYGFFLENIKDVTDAHLDAELRAGLEEIQPGCFNIEIIINRKQDFASIKGVHNNAA